MGGNALTALTNKLYGTKDVRMLICGKEDNLLCHVAVLIAVGLDAAGKTTMLYKLKLGEVVTTIPTIGMYYCSKVLFLPK